LHELSRILTAVDGASTQVDDPFVRRALLLLSLNLGFVALAIATLARMRYGRADLLDPGPMLAAVLMPALLLAAVYLVSAARWLRSSARAHRVLAELIVLGVPAMVCCSFGVVREANMTFDASAPAWRVVELATTEVRTYRCGRGNRRTCRTYLLHLPGDIDTGRTPRTLELDRAEFASLPRRGPVAVDLRPGALGFAWVAAKRPG
jgi:hypothetical protein